MDKNTEPHTRTWDLTLVVGLLVALSAVTDAIGFLRLAPSFGLPAWVAALAVVPIKLIEWNALTFGVRLWRKGWHGKLQCPVYWIIWIAAVALSALATHATMYTFLATADYTATRNAVTRGNLAAAHQRVTGQLDTFAKSPPRPVNTVEKDLAWANSVLRPPLDCTRAPDEGSRACRRVVELRKELAAATDYERLIREEQELREKLAGLKIEAANDAMPQAFEASIGQVIKMDGRNGIALMVTLILGLVSAFGPFGLDTLRVPHVGRARSDPPVPGEGSLPSEGALHVAPGRRPEGDPAVADEGGLHGEGGLPATAGRRPESDPAVPDEGGLPGEGPLPAAPGPDDALPGEGASPALPGCRPEGARVIQFPDVQGGPQASTSGRAASPSERATRSPTGGRLGQAYKRARKPRDESAMGTTGGDARGAPADVSGGANHDVAIAAVRAFVGMLDMGRHARATGSELFQAYVDQRLVHGWPALSANNLGMHLKAAVEQLGGRKLKSDGRQVYEGVCLPEAWRELQRQSA